MDLKKQLEFFDPNTLVNDEIHIIGLGAIGSTVCEMLTRMGIEEIHIYDFDTVSPHNLANQMFLDSHIGLPKIEAVAGTCTGINPEIKINMHSEGYKPGMRLSGYVFLCVDNIDLRREIATEHQHNPMIKGMFDFRMGLTDAQHYAANWADSKSKDKFIASMQFTHEEAKDAMPVSACGLELNVIPTVRTIVSYGIANWMNFTKTKNLKTIILADIFNFTVDTF